MDAEKIWHHTENLACSRIGRLATRPICRSSYIYRSGGSTISEADARYKGIFRSSSSLALRSNKVWFWVQAQAWMKTFGRKHYILTFCSKNRQARVDCNIPTCENDEAPVKCDSRTKDKVETLTEQSFVAAQNINAHCCGLAENESASDSP